MADHTLDNIAWIVTEWSEGRLPAEEAMARVQEALAPEDDEDEETTS